MPLDPHVKTLLDAMAALPAPDFATLRAADYRAALAANPAMFAPGDAVERIEDREIPGPAGTLRLRLYYPEAAAGEALPLTLFFHGGGFVLCSPETHDNICRCLAARARSLVVSVDYRLAPEAPFPAAVDDAIAALDWLRREGRALGGDPARIAVAGDSAGGNLAAVLAQQARSRGWPLRHQLLFYPITDCATESDSYRQFGAGYFLTAEMMRWYRRQYLSQADDGQDCRASPLRAEDFGGLPPATIITAEFDPLRDEGEAYALSLRLAGVPAGLHRAQGQIHGYVSMLGLVPAADEALSHGAAALHKAFVGC